MEHNFQINLQGIITLLSEHLYSSPDVYVRELLQNAVDAISARQLSEPDVRGQINIELFYQNQRPMLLIEDNGIGLTETEVHTFLSVIGQSSKTEELTNHRDAFIGQFGIGLLSCFMVSDEVQVISRSVKSGHGVHWRGRPDGKYLIERYEAPLEIGTKVLLQCKDGMEARFTTQFLHSTAFKYGAMLPIPIFVIAGEDKKHINTTPPPWHDNGLNPNELKAHYMSVAQQMLFETPLDAVLLQSNAGGIQGVAYILPYAYKHTAKVTHAVYLKNMLLSENAENLLPPWAFFVRCVINATKLRPTASREAFYDDAVMQATREDLGNCIRNYLKNLAHTNPRLLQEILRIHNLAIKALALEDDEFYKMIIDHIPMETSMGRVTLGEYKKHNKTIRFVFTLDQYRQVAQVAFAHSIWLINGGYIYDSELLQKHALLFPETSVEAVDVASLSHAFKDLDYQERKLGTQFLDTCSHALAEFQCSLSIKKFLPKDLPALFIIDESGNFARSIQQSRAISDSVWGEVLGKLTPNSNNTFSQLCFNFDNPLVQKLLQLDNNELLQNCVRMLYVQALLLGHHPLNANEMAVLNSGLQNLIDFSLQSQLKAQQWQTLDPKSLN